MIDILNQKFGQLTVIEYVEKRKNNHYWKCVCECGKEKIIKANNLIYKKTQSCGCLMVIKSQERRKDLTGIKLGMLEVIKFSNRRIRKNRSFVYWLCSCKCGRQVEIPSSSIIRGKIKSCGCFLPQRQKFGNSSFKHLFYQYKAKARIRNYSFELNAEEFELLIQGNCYYCNIEPKQIHKKKNGFGHILYNGIDRKDNTKGYTIENSVSCCGICNEMKMTKSENEFKQMIKKIYEHLDLK